MSPIVRRFGLSVAAPLALALALALGTAFATPAFAVGGQNPSLAGLAAATMRMQGTAQTGQPFDWRASAAASKERRASRDAYRNASRADAIWLGRRFFPEAFAAPLFDGKQPSPGLDIINYPGPNTAVAKTSDGTKYLLQSTVPLRARTPIGAMAPVDLSLRQSTTTFTTANSSADLQISADADKGAELLGAGLAFAPQTGPDAVGTKTADRVFYSDTQTDTDFVVTPTPTGGDFSWLLRSPDAPERLVLNVALPDGAVIRPAVSDHPIPGDPPRSLEIAKDGQAIAYVRPPVVNDADGVSVPATMTVEGSDKIVLNVSHHGSDLHYPLYADPEVNLQSGISAPWSGWGASQVPSSASRGSNYYGFALRDCAYNCSGPYMSMPTNTWFSGSGTGVSYAIQAPAGAYISRVQISISHLPLRNGYSFSQIFDGIINYAQSAWEPGVTSTFSNGAVGGNPFGPYAGAIALPGLTQDFCCVSASEINSGAADGNRFNMTLRANYAGGPFFTYGYSAQLTSAGAGVYLGDIHRPTFTGLIPSDTGWVDDSTNRTHSQLLSAHDDGLGLNNGITFAGAATGNRTSGRACDGNPYGPAPCDHDYRDTFSYTLNEGSSTLNAETHDIIGNSAPITWTAKIDRSDPEMELPLVGEATPNAPEEPEPAAYVAVNDQTFSLQVAAKDQYSGVREVRLLNQSGALVDRKPMTCSPQCPTAPATVALTGTVSQLSETQHYTVEVVDGVNRTSRMTVLLIADRVAPPAPTELVLHGFKLGSSASVGWEPAADPDLSDGTAGSGVARSEYRYRRILGGTFTDWVATEETEFEISGGLPGDLIEVQARLIDVAGNVGATTTASVILLPVGDPAPRPQPSGGSNIISVLENFNIRGTLSPRAGLPVVLRSLATGETFGSETGTDGKATFRNVPDGDYNVETNDGQQAQSASVTGGVLKELSGSLGYDATDEEINFCTANRKQQFACFYFQEDASKAQHFAERLFTQPEPQSDDTRTNAFKHSYWLAMMVRSLAYDDGFFSGAADYPLALAFANAHEARTRNSAAAEDRRATTMDDHNNLVGYNLAVRNEPDGRGIEHNDLFLCNTLRGRIHLAQFARFRKGVTNAFSQPVSSLRPVYIRMTHRVTKQKDRLLNKDEFSNGQPCVDP